MRSESPDEAPADLNLSQFASWGPGSKQEIALMNLVSRSLGRFYWTTLWFRFPLYYMKRVVFFQVLTLVRSYNTCMERRILTSQCGKCHCYQNLNLTAELTRTLVIF
jgi:hypothetical protein